MAERFRILELWRISAAMLVMVFHYLNYGPDSAVRATERMISLLPLMDMFFMISGFLIMLHYGPRLLTAPGSYLRFLIRRVARFYPLYLATLIFFVCVGIAVNQGHVSTEVDGRYDFSALPANILLMQGWGLTDTLTFNYVGWTLSAEWFCYLVLPVIVLAFRHGGFAGLTALIAATLVALEAAVVAGIIPFRDWLLADTWGAYRAFADFAIGALLAEIVRARLITIRSHWPAWLCFAVTVFAMWTWHSGYVVLALLAISILLAASAEGHNPNGARMLAIFDPLARASFTVYLLHPVVGTVLLGVVWRYLLEPAGVIDFYLFLPIVVLLTAGLSMLSLWLFETPASRLVTRWLEGPRTESVRVG